MLDQRQGKLGRVSSGSRFGVAVHRDGDGAEVCAEVCASLAVQQECDSRPIAAQPGSSCFCSLWDPNPLTFRVGLPSSAESLWKHSSQTHAEYVSK